MASLLGTKISDTFKDFDDLFVWRSMICFCDILSELCFLGFRETPHQKFYRQKIKLNLVNISKIISPKSCKIFIPYREHAIAGLTLKK
jgi:hypothetical protein